MMGVVPNDLPLLPLVLWEVPEGLVQALGQEGVPFTVVRTAHPLAFAAGRFVLYDGRRVSPMRVRTMLTTDHVPIDVDALRDGEPSEPFAALIDTTAARQRWRIDGVEVEERVSRNPKAAIRRRILGRLRTAIDRSGGLWVRLAAFPFPFRSAFNFRADLDEPYPDDCRRFLRAARPFADCLTLFVSTQAYGRDRTLLHELRRYDVQSHGHHHVVYRDARANRRNLTRADTLLRAAGIEPTGFAAPEGRWNEGLDRVIESLGYGYSSDFHLSYDDLPFYPIRDDGPSGVLQVPIHPICEGLFLDAGVEGPLVLGEYLARVARAKIDAGEPAFVYGHPERRLGRLPGVLAPLAAEVGGESLLWRVTLTEFARWWRWRGDRRWALLARTTGRIEAQFEDWDASYPLALEIVRGEHVASLPLRGPRLPIRLEDLAYERRRPHAELPQPTPSRVRPGLKAMVKTALDWETVTPFAELPDDTIRARLKRRLRGWRSGEAAA